MEGQQKLTTDRKQNLIRILSSETADHPLMPDAILVHLENMDETRWDDTPETEQLASRLANAIEDRCAYKGLPLDNFIREPYLSHWRRTCFKAMVKAQIEADR